MDIKSAVATFFICIIIAVSVTFFQGRYFSDKFLEYKSSEISEKLLNSKDFALTASRLLSSGDDISYLKLFDSTGVLQHSFGDNKVAGAEKIVVKVPDGRSIIMGLKTVEVPVIDSYSLIWSVLIGVSSALILISIISIKSLKPAKLVKQLEDSMERISQGDYEAKLDIDSLNEKESHMIRVYESFNKMVDSLNVKYKEWKKESEPLKEITSSNSTRFEENESSKTAWGVKKKGVSEDSFQDKDEEESRDQEQENVGVEKVERLSMFSSGVALPYKVPSLESGNLGVLIVKVEDFENLSEGFDTSESNMFLTGYNKFCGRIIKSYGGIVRTVFRGEIVATFKFTDEKNYPELMPICAAVEVLQELTNIAKKKKAEGNRVVTGKIGISMKKSSVPDEVENAIKDARNICENTKIWKLCISPELYKKVKDFVEASQYVVNSETIYLVTGVEQGVVHPEKPPLA